MGNKYYTNIIFFDVVNNIPFTFPTWTSEEVDVNVLKTYEGIYETDSLPLDITISIKQGKLFAQATGQSAFPLAAQSDTEFKFEGADITIIFNKPNGFHFNQNGYKATFVKK